MEKKNHTPGPWRHTGEASVIVRAGNIHVASCPRSLDAVVAPISRLEREANARLIAAAPALLAALEKAAQRITQLCETANALSEAAGLGRKVRAEDFLEGIPEAIRQAKGEG